MSEKKGQEEAEVEPVVQAPVKPQGTTLEDLAAELVPGGAVQLPEATRRIVEAARRRSAREGGRA